MARLAIIGGTGVYESGILEGVEDLTLVTPYGTVNVQSGTMKGPSGRRAGVVFLARHGRGHDIPPHRVNHRANIWALRALGVERIIGTGAVGSLRLEMRPGDCVSVDQFIDFTHGRAATFFEGAGGGGGEAPPEDEVSGATGGGAVATGEGSAEAGEGAAHAGEGAEHVGEGRGQGPGFGSASGLGLGLLTGRVVHTDMTEPYCPELRAALRQAGIEAGVTLHDGGCYVCTEGPRFETAAEIRMFRLLGADVVGMTNVPEVVLARELGICYALVAMVTNYAAGITGKPLTHAEVVETMEENVRKIRALAWRALDAVPAERRCRCTSAGAEKA